jgi:hypothetical protein
MVSIVVMRRNSLREMLPPDRARQRRSTAPATAPAETGQPCGVPKVGGPFVTARAARPNPSLKRSANGRPPGPV